VGGALGHRRGCRSDVRKASGRINVSYTDDALRDLDEILAYIGLNYPAILVPFKERLRAIKRRIGQWPKYAREVEQRPGRNAP
jgi:plasmid stabilization system protein ParE